MKAQAERACVLCDRALEGRITVSAACKGLSEIDSVISKSSAKDAASLVFPPQKKLETLTSRIPNTTPREKALYPLWASRVVYGKILESAGIFEKYL